MKHNKMIFRNVSTVSFLVYASMSLAQPYADCDSAYWVGKKYSIHFSGASGVGKNNTEADLTDCFLNGENYGQAEENSIWLRFDIDSAGILKFTIMPDIETDDYDFVLYQLPRDGNCARKKIVRCMAAGSSVNQPGSPCLGATGLREKSRDTSEDAGCSDQGDDAWLAAVKARAGERYVLLVSNVTAPYNGFTIRFKGNCTFRSLASQ